MSSKAVVVIGAGPYGLSVAAHLRGRGIPARVFGDPMAFWRRMPTGMFLKSPWTASSLSDPSGAFSLDRYVEAGPRADRWRLARGSRSHGERERPAL